MFGKQRQVPRNVVKPLKRRILSDFKAQVFRHAMLFRQGNYLLHKVAVIKLRRVYVDRRHQRPVQRLA